MSQIKLNSTIANDTRLNGSTLQNIHDWIADNYDKYGTIQLDYVPNRGIYRLIHYQTEFVIATGRANTLTKAADSFLSKYPSIEAFNAESEAFLEKKVCDAVKARIALYLHEITEMNLKSFQLKTVETLLMKHVERYKNH